MSLKDQMLRDARQAILNTDEMAELITYTPYGGSGRTIKAIVNREPLKTSSIDEGRTLQRHCRVFVANHASDGVVSVAVRRDKVSLPVNEGGVSVVWDVSQVLSKDEGMWELLLTGGL